MTKKNHQPFLHGPTDPPPPRSCALGVPTRQAATSPLKPRLHAAHLHANVEPISLTLNPAFLATFLAYFSPPPSQWAAVIALETVAREVVAALPPTPSPIVTAYHFRSPSCCAQVYSNLTVHSFF